MKIKEVMNSDKVDFTGIRSLIFFAWLIECV